MKKAEDIILELAELYGIEVVDVPNKHTVVDTAGNEHPLTFADYHNLLGLRERNDSALDQLTQLQCFQEFDIQVDLYSPEYGKLEYKNIASNEVFGSLSYAIAA